MIDQLTSVAKIVSAMKIQLFLRLRYLISQIKTGTIFNANMHLQILRYRLLS